MDLEEQEICTANNVDFNDTMDEETLALSSSSAVDRDFDIVIGCIEDIIMEYEVLQLQQNFMEKYYSEFDDSDENKLIYTSIFNEYVNLLEKYLEQQLLQRIPEFNMNSFIQLILQHKEEVPTDIFDVLLSFTDFIAFKEMFLDYKAEKEGRGLDSSQDLVVTPLTSSYQKHSDPS